MKNSDRIYNDMIDLWEKYNSHPFVQGLADGTLPKEKFKFFMIQDHLYLSKRQIMRRGQKQRRCLISGVVCDTFPGVPLPTAEVHPAQ